MQGWRLREGRKLDLLMDARHAGVRISEHEEALRWAGRAEDLRDGLRLVGLGGTSELEWMR